MVDIFDSERPSQPDLNGAHYNHSSTPAADSLSHTLHDGPSVLLEIGPEIPPRSFNFQIQPAHFSREA